MRKLIAAINITIDGFCDHTAGVPDAEIHDHYTELLRSAGAILYGRITYELMKSYWPTLVKNPSGEKAMDDFALAIQDVPKIVFSRTLTNVDPMAIDPMAIGWENATLAQRGIEEEVSALKQQAGKDVFVGSPSLIDELTDLNLIDEYQLCVHPVIVGKGLQLFKSINERIILKLLKTKTFRASGAILLYYEPAKR